MCFFLHFVFVSFVDFSYFACLLSFAIEKIFALCVWKRVFWAVQAVKSILNWDNSKSKSNNSSNNWQATKATTTIRQQHLNNAHVVVAGRFNFFLPFFCNYFCRFCFQIVAAICFVCMCVCMYIWEIKRVLFCSFCIACSTPRSCSLCPSLASALLALSLSLPLSLSSSLSLPQISRSRSRIRSVCLPCSASLPSPLSLLPSPSGLYIFQCHAIFIQNLLANKIELNMEKEHNENWKFALGFSNSFPLFLF